MPSLTVIKDGQVASQVKDGISPVSLPSGLIAMWHGLIANIPSGWFLCNGSNGTPDLREKFVRGAPNATEAGDTGGEDTHILSVAELPSHTHTVTRSNSVGAVEAVEPATTGGTVTTVNTGATGSGTAHENRPAYYQVLYIMKA